MNFRFFSVFMLFFVCGWHSSDAQTNSSWIRDNMWAGGLNSCQFCAIDLNLDGLNDLLIFDRMGNRKITYINLGGSGSVNYRYAPEYASSLPEMQEWVITADYDCDGKMDLFTYHNGGVRVYRNISEGSLSFHLQTNLLKSWYYSGFVGILVTSVDYPAIADVDGDGDLDLITFFGLGSYAEYHKNLSQETFGNCDSLYYRLDDPCWGKFRESVDGNKITLNAPCPFTGELAASQPSVVKAASQPSVVKAASQPSVVRAASQPSLVGAAAQPSLVGAAARPSIDGPVIPLHTGSTMLATDLNGDGLCDLVLGDVDYPNLIALTNGGTRDSALMVSQDTLFPSLARPVDLWSFPALSFTDLDNDGVRDLLVSPFDPSYYKTENKKSCWYYHNDGSNTHPVFTYITDELFQSSMLDFGSGSNPVAVDLDRDGLADIVAGNYGYFDSASYNSGVLQSYFTSSLAFLKNTGSSSEPAFTLLSPDLGKASALGIHGLYPAFADLNGDGILDMLCGCEAGTLFYFQGRGDSAGIPVFGHPQSDFQKIKTGAFSAPQLFDLDKDGLTDLIIGQQKGTMRYYHNTGSAANPVFTFVKDSLGGVDVTNHGLSYFGYLTPYFFSRQGRTWLLAGSEEGRMRLFTDIDGNLGGKFTESDSLMSFIGITADTLRIGWRASGFLSKLSSSVYYDLVCGNFSGGLNYFTRGKVPGIDTPARQTEVSALTVFPNPARDRIRLTIGKKKEADALNTAFTGLRAKLNIYNSIGMLVVSMDYSSGQEILVSGLGEGIYLAVLTVQGSAITARGKFIIR